MLKACINLAKVDILINYTAEDTMLINLDTGLAWYGPHEKDARFIQFIVEGMIDKGDVVLDCSASTVCYLLYIFF